MAHPLSKALREKAIRDACNMQNIAVKTVEWQAADALDARATTEAEWQDISTAPKDGTEILVCRHDGVGWEYDVVFWSDRDLGYPWAMTGTVDDGWAEGRLDYWMPLPHKPGEPK